MSRPITATLTRCRFGNALIVLDSQPFNGMEATPADLRVMADRLTALADMADKTPTGGKHWHAKQVQLGEGQSA